MSNSQRRVGHRSRPSPYDRSSSRRQHDHPLVSELQVRITPHSREITIIYVSSRDLVGRAVRHQYGDYFNGGSSQNSSDDSQLLSQLLSDDELLELLFDDELLFVDQEANTEEIEDDATLLGYFKTRIHRVADGVNHPTETEEICAICQAGFEHEESIGTLGCGHEYHTNCIKQWLSRKKNCPMCRASVLP